MRRAPTQSGEGRDRRRSGRWPALLALFLGAACGRAGIDWQSHLSLRSLGADLHLGQIDPGELVHAKVSRNLHYISLALDTVFFRDLPGMPSGAEVILGVELEGVLPGGKVLQTVSGVTQASGGSGFLLFDNVALLEPFLYLGRNVTITLHFRSAGPDEARSVRGRIAGAGEALKRLNTRAAEALGLASQLFAGVVGATSRASTSWKYAFTLFPADSVIRDKPEALLTAARHILLAMPPPSAPKGLRDLRPSAFLPRLKLRANRLVWKEDDREYTETPYIVLNVTRFKRYPRPDTELRQLVHKMETSFERGNHEHAQETLRSVREAIVRDPVITATEKNLERTWTDFWKERIEAALAARRGDKTAELHAVERQASVLLRMKELFGNILEPFEVKDIGYQLTMLRDRADALGKEVAAKLAGDLRRRFEEDQKRDREVALSLQAEEARLRQMLAARGAESGGWVEVDAFETAQPGESTEALRARALVKARRMAVEKVTGSEIQQRFFGTPDARGLENRRVTEHLSALLSDALILDERLVREGREGAGYRARLRARVALRGARTDPGYAVRVTMSKQELAAGEEVEVRATATRDSHLYLFSVGAGGEVTLLLPNAHTDVPFLRAGAAFVFPGTELAQRGIKVLAQLPTGASESVEQVKAIALRRPVPLVKRPGGSEVFQSFEGKRTLLLTAILRELAGLDPDEWCDDTLSYTIRKK